MRDDATVLRPRRGPLCDHHRLQPNRKFPPLSRERFT